MNDRKKQLVEVSQLEMWVIRGFGLGLLAFLGWFASSFQTVLIDIAEIRKELEVVKPSDVLAAVRSIEKEQVTRADVEQIVQNQHHVWRVQMEGTVKDLIERIDKLWKRSDMQEWAYRLERALNEAGVKVSVPQLPKHNP